MTPRRWFFNRWKADLRFQCRVFSTVVDWTVALYVVVPGLILLVERYTAWWRGEAAWTAEVPSPLLWTAAFLFAWSGPFRLYLEPADQLFMWQRSDWMKTFILTGLWFGWGKRALESFSVFGSDGTLSALQDRFLFAFAGGNLAFPVAGQGVFGHCPKIYGRDGRHASQGADERFDPCPGRGCVCVDRRIRPSLRVLRGGGALAGCWSLLAWLRSRQKGAFFPEIDYEQAQRMRWAALLLQASGVVHQRFWVRKRPWLFPRSIPLFRRRTVSRIVAEAVIKSFLRSGRQLVPYFQLVAVCAFALLGDPAPFAVGVLDFVFLSVFPVGAFRLEGVAFSNGMFDVWSQSGFKVRGAFHKAVFVLQQIGFLPLSAVMGAVTFGAWGAVWMLLPVGRSPMLPFSCFSAWPLIFSAGRERAALQGSCWRHERPGFHWKTGPPRFYLFLESRREISSP